MYTEDSSTGFFSGLKTLFKKQENESLSSDENELPLNEMDMQQTEKSETEERADKPMGTRTVDYSSINETLSTEVEENILEEMVEDLDISFATKFTEKGGKFIFCESVQEAIEQVKLIAKENNWQHVFYWENEIKDAFYENNFQRGAIGYTIENSDAAIYLCEGILADSGNILLNCQQASRRRLKEFPKAQIILTDTTKMLATLAKGIDVFHQKHKGELPSVLDLNDNCKGQFYHNNQLVLKTEGSSDLYVILTDEFISPSKRA